MPIPLTAENRRRLVRRREELGLTQGQLASACGYSRPQINMVERGAKDPSETQLRKIAKALRLELSLRREVTKVFFRNSQ